MALIGPWGKGRDPRVERAPGPGEWEDPHLGGARGRSLVFPAGLSFPLAGSLLSPRDGMVRPTLLAFPPLLPFGAWAPPPSWHVRLRERAKPWLWEGADRGTLPRWTASPTPSSPPPSVPVRDSELSRGQPGSCQARGGGAGRAAATSPGRALPPEGGGERLVTAGRWRRRSGAGFGASRPAP